MTTLRTKLAPTMAAMFTFAVLVVLAMTIAGCGSDTNQKSNTSGNPTDAGFAEEMITHHEGAIAMAGSAQDRADHPEVKKLAAAIIVAQESEISQMQLIGRELAAAGIETKPLAMNDAQMGMDFEMPMLDQAEDFDKAFIDMMIPHHRGAIAMAKLQLKEGSNEELNELARNVIEAQTDEIAQMQSWRKDWYGSELSGADDDGSMDHGAMDHDGM